MQLRKYAIALATLAVMAMGQSSAKAGFSGSIGIVDIANATTVTGSTSTGVTSVSFAELFTTMGGSGPFASQSLELLGPATLTVADPTAFSFGTTSFGTFTGSTVTVEQTSSTSETIYVLGNFAVGTNSAYTGLTGGPASFIFSITQNQGSATYSASGNLALPPAPLVPEPASVVMLGMGLVGFGGVALRRRMAK